MIYSVIPNVNAHSFYTNRDSMFFTLLKRYEVEDFLALENLTSSKVLALEHAQNSASLMKQLVAFNNDTTITTNLNRFENAFSNANLSTKAIVAADLADESLKQYGLARGLNETAASDLKNMSMGMIMNMGMLTDQNMARNSTGQVSKLTDQNMARNSTGQVSKPDMSMSSGTPPISTFNGINSNGTNSSNVNKGNYGTSITVAKSLKTLFTNNLENATLEKSTGLMQIPMSMKRVSVTSLKQGIDGLIQAINSNSSLDHVYSIVHGQIHPNLYLAYNLKLKGD